MESALRLRVTIKTRKKTTIITIMSIFQKVYIITVMALAHVPPPLNYEEEEAEIL